MKNQFFALFGYSITTFCALFLSGCLSPRSCDEVVKETYVHPYGVPVVKSDWQAQGETGNVVRVTKEGVTVTQSFVAGQLEGETTYTFPHSSVTKRTEVFHEGALQAVRDHYSSGVPMREEVYDQGEVAKVLTWYTDGTPSSLEWYQGGALIQGEYYTPLNERESTVYKGQGVRIHRATDGHLLAKESIERGERVERVTYFPSGEPESVIPYVEGKIHGTLLTYFPGGEPKSAEEWNHGVQEGMTLLYQNGEKYAEIPYVAGKKQGLERRYRDGAILAEEISWKEDVQHGIRQLHVEGVTKTEWYHEGALVSRSTFERMNLPR